MCNCTYAWVITQDLIENGEAVGTKGPKETEKLITEIQLFGEAFRMLDDDKNIYYYGNIMGDYEGFEPLDDFGTSNAGCTIIQYLNKSGEWETL